MKIWEKIKRFIEQTSMYWYLIVAMFVLLEVINYGFLSIALPDWMCNIVAIVLLCVLTGYIHIVLMSVIKKISFRINSKDETITQKFDLLENCIEQLSQKIVDSEQEICDIIKKEIIKEAENVIAENYSAISKTSEEIKDSLDFVKNEMQKDATKNYELIIGQIENAFEKNNDSISTAENAIKSSISMCSSEITKHSDEVYNELTKQSNNSKQCIIDEMNKFKLESEKNTSKNIETISKIINSETADIVNLISNNSNKVYDEFEKQNTSNQKRCEDLREVMITKVNEIISNMEDELQEKNNFDTSNFDDIKQKLFDLDILINDRCEKVCKTANEIADIETKNIESAKYDIIQNLQEISFAQNELFGKTIDIITQKSDNVSDNINLISKSISDDISQGKEKIEALSETLTKGVDLLANKTDYAYTELCKLLNQILKYQEIDEDKTQIFVDKMFDEFLNFAQSIKTQIEEVQDSIKSQQAASKHQNDVLENAVNEQATKIFDIKNQVDVGFINTTQQNKELYQILDNVNIRTLNICSLVETLKSISIVQSSESHDNDTEIEKIEDVETGSVIHNHYKNKRLVCSEMFLQNKKTFVIDYDKDGTIKKSKNYNEKGEVITELDFYSNGQIKKRSEKIIIDGKKQIKISKFDEKGNKIK